MDVVVNDTRLIMNGGSDLEKTEEKADKNVDVLSKGRNDFDDDEEFAEDGEFVEGDDEFAKMLRENQYIMLGLKAGPHVIRDYQFKFNNVPITTRIANIATPIIHAIEF